MLNVLQLAVLTLGWRRFFVFPFHVFFHEVLPLFVVLPHYFYDVLGELVVEATALDVGDLVVGVRPSQLVAPLHFFSLNHKLG